MSIAFLRNTRYYGFASLCYQKYGKSKRRVERMKKWMAAVLAATLSFGAVPVAAADYGTCTLTYADKQYYYF